MNILKTTLLAGAAAGALFTASAQAAMSLSLLDRYETGIYKESAAEIVAFDATTGSVYFVNGAAPAIGKLSLSAEGKLTDTGMTLALAETEAPTSVDVHEGLIVASVHDGSNPMRPGKVVFFDNEGKRIGEIAVGSLPDMVTFTPDGSKVLTANEGEPDGDVDPAGSISIVSVSQGKDGLELNETRIGFSGMSVEDAKAKGLRLFPGKTPAEDFEPEYIAVSADGSKAWASLQEANALAVIDVAGGKLIDVVSLGTKDHSRPGNGMDVDDKDIAITIAPRKTRGMYMPDAITAMEAGGNTYVLTANEGDARDEDERIKDVTILDPAALSDEDKVAMGRLKISQIDGDTDGDGDIDVVHNYGARSFTVFAEDGSFVWDSGDQFAQITSEAVGIEGFNSHNKANGKGDNRSDDKGMEPEAITTGVIGDQTYAFIGLERTGGIMVYNVTDPTAPSFESYEAARDFNPELNAKEPADLSKIGDLGPEGVAFIPAAESPTGKDLLLVASEVSGTVSLFEVAEK